MDIAVLEIFLHSLKVTTLIFGGIRIIGEVFLSFIPLGILLTVCVVAAIYYFRVPPPKPEVVDAIIGKDLAEVDSNSSAYVVRSVAHRGAALDAPENTLEAFAMCKEKGCDFIEFDVSLTADGVPIIFHDDTTERVADCDLVICDRQWSELSRVNISAKHPFKDRYPQTNIPTLEQTVNQLLAAGQKMFIDIKDHDLKMVKVILDLFEQHPELESRAIVTTFFPSIIYLIRRQNPKIVCSMAWRPYFFSHKSYSFAQGVGPKRDNAWYGYYLRLALDIVHEWLLSRITYYFLGLSLILLHKDVLETKSLRKWRSKGIRVMAWTVNSPIEKQYLAKILKIAYFTDTFTGEATTHSAH